ncbi:MAG: hypothetical protein M3Q71_02255 [Chloroflexota bacterium]|nr:hypothetical protein [Chloroflexota bacterium]MDP9469476.1 hypothetical protein [Chloroflexota bacterium]
MRPIHRPGNRSDNLVLVPASLLPAKKAWQQVANTLSRDEVLLVLPVGDTPLRSTMNRVAVEWRARGGRMSMLNADRLFCRPNRVGRSI